LVGARKWQVGLNSDADEFRRAILNIYPRLANTTGYTLWNVKKDKTFEKLPVKVNISIGIDLRKESIKEVDGFTSNGI
jgi:hypothetical protein